VSIKLPIRVPEQRHVRGLGDTSILLDLEQIAPSALSAKTSVSAITRFEGLADLLEVAGVDAS
jgi:hypothetical protein